MAKSKGDKNTAVSDPRFKLDNQFHEAGPSGSDSDNDFSDSENETDQDEEGEGSNESDTDNQDEEQDGFEDGMNPEGFAGPSNGKMIKILTPEALAAARAAQERAGVVYISRIPPGMRSTKVRHLMSQYGEVGHVYLQQEGTLPHL